MLCCPTIRCATLCWDRKGDVVEQTGSAPGVGFWAWRARLAARNRGTLWGRRSDAKRLLLLKNLANQVRPAGPHVAAHLYPPSEENESRDLHNSTTTINFHQPSDLYKNLLPPVNKLQSLKLT